MKISLKISYFLKTLQKDLKKVNVDQSRYSKKTVYIENEKKKAQEMRINAIKRFGETKKREVQDESDTGDKNLVEGVVQKWLVFIRFIREKLEQSLEFRSEDLQEENNE